MSPSRPGERVFRLLPLLLLAAMIVVGFGIEAVFFDQVVWLAKLPLIAMLALAFWKKLRNFPRGLLA